MCEWVNLLRLPFQTQVNLEIEKCRNEQEEKFLAELKSLKVDMTQYMLHQQPRYKINQEIIVGPSLSSVDSPIWGVAPNMLLFC